MLLTPASIDAIERLSDVALKSCLANASSPMLPIRFCLRNETKSWCEKESVLINYKLNLRSVI